MTMDEMIEKFEITDIHKSGAVLDPIKLDWMNGEYIKRMEISELHTRLTRYLEEYEGEFYSTVFSEKDYQYNTKIIRELQTRMKKFDEYIDITKSLYECGMICVFWDFEFYDEQCEYDSKYCISEIFEASFIHGNYEKNSKKPLSILRDASRDNISAWFHFRS